MLKGREKKIWKKYIKKENKTRAEEEKRKVSKNGAKIKVKKRQGKRKKDNYEGNGRKRR